VTTDTATAPADVVVGLSAHGRADADPGAVCRSIARTLTELDASLRWRIVVADPGSDDGVLERMRVALGGGDKLLAAKYAPQPSDSLDLPYHGLPGRARAVRAILGAAHDLGARGCVVVDPRSVTAADGVGHLVRPLIAGAADYVAGGHSRHPFSGGLVHGVVYPLFRALYGVRLKFPMTPEFGCSAQLIDATLADPVWQTDAGQRGIDLWLPATAASGGFRLGQALLGPQVEGRASLDLGTTVSQVVGFLFADLERRASVWQRIRGSRPPSQFGNPLSTPAPPDIDAAELADSFRRGSRALHDVWEEVLPPLAILQWRRLVAAPLEAFRVDDALWARTVYDFALGHRLRVIAREHLLGSLTPLYLGWLASFVLEVRHAPPQQAEARIERLCVVFETEKPYLISQWRWPARFRPVRVRR
jgi:hypothetical protein